MAKKGGSEPSRRYVQGKTLEQVSHDEGKRCFAIAAKLGMFLQRELDYQKANWTPPQSYINRFGRYAQAIVALRTVQLAYDKEQRRRMELLDDDALLAELQELIKKPSPVLELTPGKSGSSS